jgi:hypothetical protein
VVEDEYTFTTSKRTPVRTRVVRERKGARKERGGGKNENDEKNENDKK